MIHSLTDASGRSTVAEFDIDQGPPVGLHARHDAFVAGCANQAIDVGDVGREDARAMARFDHDDRRVHDVFRARPAEKSSGFVRNDYAAD